MKKQSYTTNVLRYMGSISYVKNPCESLRKSKLARIRKLMKYYVSAGGAS